MFSHPAAFPGLGSEGLRRAVEIYLKAAYPSGSCPRQVQHRLDWPVQGTLEEILRQKMFERTRSDTGAELFKLRLGNHVYPWMKLQIQAWPNSDGYLLSVDTHDRLVSPTGFFIDPPGFQEFQRKNQEIKEEIESEWDRAGLPTFCSFMRNYLEESRAGSAPGSAAETC